MPSDSRHRSRRTFLAGATTLAALFAGCLGGTGPSGTDATSTAPSTDTKTTESATDATTAPGSTTDPGTSTPCPDREEKTLTYDPDADCPGYRIDDLVVVPPDDREATIGVRIVRLADDAVVLDETVETDGNDSIRFRDPITDAGRHRITVSLADGPEESYEWDVPEGEVETDAHGLIASVGSGGIEFTTVVQ